MKLSRIVLSIFFLVTFTVFVSASVNVSLTDFKMLPEKPKVGDNVTFSCVLQVHGADVMNLTVKGGVDTSTLLNKSYFKLNNGYKTTLSFKWTAKAAKHAAWFKLYFDRSTRDENYGDNQIRKEFEVYVVLATKLRPALQVQTLTLALPADLAFFDVGIGSTSGNIQVNFSFKMHIYNDGGTEAKNFYGLILIEKVGTTERIEIKTPVYKSLMPKKWKRFWKNMTITESGRYKATFTIDPEESVKEGNRANNKHTQYFTAKAE